jgi:cell division protein FtsA
VVEPDIVRACANAKHNALPPGRVYIHHVLSGYFLDGKYAENPLALIGTQLEAQYWHVHGDEVRVSNHLRMINGLGMQVQDMILSSIASASLLATDNEKQQGVLVIDIGAGTTDYCLYRRGRIVRTGVVPVGGDHFTNDLSLGLRINAQQAEKLKVREGRAVVDKTDKNETVMLVGDLSIGDRPLPRLAIARVLHARAEELFMIIKNRLGSLVSPQNLPGGVIVTGGGSRLFGLLDCAHATLGVEARDARSADWLTDPELRQPEYACVLGLLYYGLRGQQAAAAKQARTRTGFIDRLAGALFR